MKFNVTALRRARNGKALARLETSADSFPLVAENDHVPLEVWE